MSNVNIKEVEGLEVTTLSDADGVEIDTGTTSVWIKISNLAVAILKRMADQAAKTTLTGADSIFILDSAASNAPKKITWTNVLAAIIGTVQTVTAAWTFGSAGAVGKLKVAGTTSGSTIIDATAVASGTLTLPAATDTLVGKATTDTLTNKTLTTPTIGDLTNMNHTHAASGATGGLISVVAPSPGGRLTLTSGTPVTTSDVGSATNVYLTPFIHNLIPLWDGTIWNSYSYSELTLALGTVTSGLPYDIFAYISAGAVAIEKLAWTNGTTRATGVSLQDGRYCKTGDKTRLYLGTIGTTSTTTTEDSIARRLVWNAYNRRLRHMVAVDTTDSWVYSTGTWRAANANTTDGAGRVICAIGLAEDVIMADRRCVFANDTATTIGYAGIGINSTSANSAQVMLNNQVPGANYLALSTATYRGVLPVGSNYIQQLEKAQAVGVTTWYGDAGDADRQGGMLVEIMA